LRRRATRVTRQDSVALLQVNEAVVLNLGTLRSSLPFLKVVKPLGNDLSGRYRFPPMPAAFVASSAPSSASLPPLPLGPHGAPSCCAVTSAQSVACPRPLQQGQVCHARRALMVALRLGWEPCVRLGSRLRDNNRTAGTTRCGAAHVGVSLLGPPEPMSLLAVH
jgi:hypothetical protein